MTTKHATPGLRDLPPAAGTTIYVIGTHLFYSELLAIYLQSHTGMQCRCAQFADLTELPARLPPEPPDKLPGKEILIFLDCTSTRETKACDCDVAKEILADRRFKVVCFNVDRGVEGETAALRKGVRGLLYTDLPIDQYPRAAQTVQKGQLWYPRSVLEKVFLEADAQRSMTDEHDAILTRREKEILTKLVSGIRNRDIAEKLCISPHTVKTHAYNIYKKINVTNRLQAAKWLLNKR